jgi:hypothetical protein
LKNKNELSKIFSQWLTITKYHPSTIIRADTISCSSQEEFEDTKGAIRNRISKNRQHNGQKTEEQTTQWPKDRRTDNTMAKRQKNRRHNGQKTEEQTTQWPKDRRTDNTMAKRQKNRQHKGQKEKDKKRSTKHTIKLKIE